MNPKMFNTELGKNGISLSDGLVQESNLIALVAPLNIIGIKAQLNEFDLKYCAKGQLAEIFLPALDQNFKGVVERIQDDNNQSDSKAGIYQLWLAVKLPEGFNTELIRFGMSAEIKLTQKIIENALVIPSSAVYFKEGKPYVYKKVPNKDMILAQSISMGHKTPSHVQIVNGLSEGDIIVRNHSSYTA